MQNINVCLSCDDNYSKYAVVLVASALSNSNPDDYINFYILDGNISEENKQKILAMQKTAHCNIKFIKVDESKFDLYKQIITHSYITLPTYFRLKIAELLPDIERVIYLDCDMVIEDSLSELYNTDLGNNIIAGVLDARVHHKRKWRKKKYINAGMILFDLDKIRKENIEDQFLEYTKSNLHSIQTGDQDIINFVLKDRIKILDGLWNVQVSSFASRTNFTNHPKIIHYISCDKPWIFGSGTYFKEKYVKYLQQTPWALNESEKEYWYKENKKVSRLNFWKRRPYCIVHPKYWYAFFRQFAKN